MENYDGAYITQILIHHYKQEDTHQPKQDQADQQPTTSDNLLIPHPREVPELRKRSEMGPSTCRAQMPLQHPLQYEWTHKRRGPYATS